MLYLVDVRHLQFHICLMFTLHNFHLNIPYFIGPKFIHAYVVVCACIRSSNIVSCQFTIHQLNIWPKNYFQLITKHVLRMYQFRIIRLSIQNFVSFLLFTDTQCGRIKRVIFMLSQTNWLKHKRAKCLFPVKWSPFSSLAISFFSPVQFGFCFSSIFNCL